MATESATTPKVIRATTLVLSYDHEEGEVCVEEKENIPYAGYLNQHASPDEQMAWIQREIIDADIPLGGLKANQRVRFTITIEESEAELPTEECESCGHLYRGAGDCPECGMER